MYPFVIEPSDQSNYEPEEMFSVVTRQQDVFEAADDSLESPAKTVMLDLLFTTIAASLLKFL